MSKKLIYNEWNPSILESRQNELASRATSIWRISYAD
jgi:hypothetical protein